MARRTIAARLRSPFALLFEYVLVGSVYVASALWGIALLALLGYLVWSATDEVVAEATFDFVWQVYIHPHLPMAFKAAFAVIAVIVGSALIAFVLLQAEKVEIYARNRLG